MTEESFQRARKVMQSANLIRGLITKAKGEVAKWSKIEDSYREDGKISNAEGAKKCLQKAIANLDRLRQKFEDLSFPENNIVVIKTSRKCDICGTETNQSNGYCPQCLTE